MGFVFGDKQENTWFYAIYKNKQCCIQARKFEFTKAELMLDHLIDILNARRPIGPSNLLISYHNEIYYRKYAFGAQIWEELKKKSF